VRLARVLDITGAAVLIALALATLLQGYLQPPGEANVVVIVFRGGVPVAVLSARNTLTDTGKNQILRKIGGELYDVKWNNVSIMVGTVEISKIAHTLKVVHESVNDIKAYTLVVAATFTVTNSGVLSKVVLYDNKGKAVAKVVSPSPTVNLMPGDKVTVKWKVRIEYDE